MKPLPIVCSVLAVMASPVSATPFGIAEGTPLSSLTVLSKAGEKTYYVAVPIPNEMLVSYAVIATPRQGVCAIIARTAPSQAFKNTRIVRSKLEQSLSRYGTPKQVKFGSNAPFMHMTSRDFPLQWSKGLPNRLSSIVLETIEEDRAFIVELSYFYKNMTGCSRDIPKGLDTGL
nr:hypothetical protein [uncultured Sphingorhabdus sp.]